MTTVLEMAVNAAAGPAAVAVGAHVNGSAITKQALAAGAAASVSRGVITALIAVFGFTNINPRARYAVVCLCCSFVAPVAVTAWVSRWLLGEGTNVP